MEAVRLKFHVNQAKDNADGVYLAAIFGATRTSFLALDRRPKGGPARRRQLRPGAPGENMSDYDRPRTIVWVKSNRNTFGLQD